MSEYHRLGLKVCHLAGVVIHISFLFGIQSLLSGFKHETGHLLNSLAGHHLSFNWSFLGTSVLPPIIFLGRFGGSSLQGFGSWPPVFSF